MRLFSLEAGPTGVLDFLVEDSASALLLDFTLEAGDWAGGNGYRRKAHSNLLLALSLLRRLQTSSRNEVDSIVIPEGNDEMISDLISFVYSGRWVGLSKS
jgi:hypothetical protein